MVDEVSWRKARSSSSNGENCVELAALPGMVAARDSKHPAGGTLRFSVTEMQTFLREARNGRYDL